MKNGNLQLYVAQFSQIRYFKPYMIPLSINLGEPSWYHDGKDRQHTFIDKNGVINGLVAWPLLFPADQAEALFTADLGCSKNCKFEYLLPNCPFISKYSENLEKLTLSKILDYLNKIVTQPKKS